MAAMLLVQSMRLPFRTATFRSATPSVLLRTLSSETASSRKDTFQQRYEEALSRLTTPSIPRSQNNNSSRSFPSYRYSRLPVDFETGKPRRPITVHDGKMLYPSKQRYDTGVTPEEMPYLHHFNHDEKPKPKFKNPRKRASKLLNELKNEKVQQSMAAKPQVFGVPFRVGDAVEIQVLEDGGVDNPQNKKLDKLRGVVLGKVNRGLDTSIYLKDVVFGEHIERKIKLHSPMVKTLKVLEENFVNKGRKKIKRAKLYYLRERKPDETRVTKW